MKLIDVLRENPMRRRKEFKPDIHGRISREIGWKRSNGDGRVVQHKFYLGNDRDKAELANARLERLWRLIEADHAIDLNGDANSDRPLWNDVTLEIGRAIARVLRNSRLIWMPGSTGKLHQAIPAVFGIWPTRSPPS